MRLTSFDGTAELHAIVSEEFAAEDEEEDDAGQDLGEIVVELEDRRHLLARQLHEAIERGEDDHEERVGVRQPRDDDRGEAAAAGGVFRQRAGDGRDGEEAREAADTTRDRHGAHIDNGDADTGIARGVLRIADDGDLIAVLRVAQVGPHEHDDEQHDHDDPHIVLVVEIPREHFADPALVQTGRILTVVDDADLDGALRALPDRAEIEDDLRGDVIHHQGEERLVGIPLRLEEAGDHAPDRAEHNGQQRHEDEQWNGRQLVAEAHQDHGAEAADQELTLCADVPEPHLKRRSKADGNAGQHHGALQELPHTLRRAKGACHHLLQHDERAAPGGGKGQQHAGKHRNEQRDHADQKRRQRTNAVPFGNADHFSSSLLNWVISRPISSLVVEAASTMPLT